LEDIYPQICGINPALICKATVYPLPLYRGDNLLSDELSPVCQSVSLPLELERTSLFILFLPGFRAASLFHRVLILTSEPFHTSCGIDDLLLAGKQGMTLGAYLDIDLLYRGKGLEFVPAGAVYDSLLKGWMDILFHSACLLSLTSNRSIA